MIYLIFILILFSLSVFDLIKLKEQRLFFYLISIGIIIAFSGLRWNTGTDWENYFEYFKTEDNYHLFEPGYVWLVKFSKLLYNNYTFFLILLSTIILTFFGKANYKLSPYPIFSVFIFISLVLPFWVRQSFSLAILFFAFYTLTNKNKKLFVFLVLFASLFHYSALIALPLIFFYDSFISPKKVFALLVAAVVISKFNLLSFVLDFFIQILGISEYLGVAKLSTYLTSETINENIDYGLRNLVSMVNIFAYVALFLFFRNRLEKNKVVFNIFLNIYLYGAIINLLSMGDVDTLRRFSMFFSIAPVILFPILIQNVKDKFLKITIVLVITVISFGRYYGNLTSYWSEYYPYISTFNKIERK